MRRAAGFILLFTVSIACWIALEHWTESLGWPPWPTVVRNALHEVLATTIAICAALIPNRRMAGALIVASFCAACFLAESIAGTQHSFSAWSTIEEMSIQTAFALAILVVVQGFRLFTGWRITRSSELAQKRPGQFQLSELAEWMMSWALLLGLNHMSGSWATASTGNAAQLSVLLLGNLAFGIPIAYLMLLPRLSAMTFLQSAMWGCCATTTWMFAQMSYIRLSTILQLWPQGVWAGAVFWCLFTSHFLAIRWLGYRWHVGEPT